MPSEIYFAAENVRVEVDEDPGQIAEVFTSAHGLPFRLTATDGDREVYVNPSTVAFWLISAPRHEFVPPTEQPEESAQPTKRREPVTDIWGQPLRRKPRG